MTKLYYAPGVCSFAPHTILHEIGKPFDIVKVDIKAKKTESGIDYTTITKRGAVPLLQLDNGDTVREGVVILQYLADQNPDKNLAPRYGTMERVRVNEWLNFITTDLHKSFFVFFYDGGDKAKDLYTTKLDRHWAMVNDELANQDYICGNDFTIADPYLYTICTWAVKTDMNLDRFPNIIAYMNRMEQRPSIQKAMEAEGLKPIQKIAA